MSLPENVHVLRHQGRDMWVVRNGELSVHTADDYCDQELTRAETVALLLDLAEALGYECERKPAG